MYQKWPDKIFPVVNFVFSHNGHLVGGGGLPPPRVTFRRVVVSLQGPGQLPVLPFACCVGLPPPPPAVYGHSNTSLPLAPPPGPGPGAQGGWRMGTPGGRWSAAAPAAQASAFEQLVEGQQVLHKRQPTRACPFPASLQHQVSDRPARSWAALGSSPLPFAHRIHHDLPHNMSHRAIRSRFAICLPRDPLSHHRMFQTSRERPKWPKIIKIPPPENGQNDRVFVESETGTPALWWLVLGAD